MSISGRGVELCRLCGGLLAGAAADHAAQGPARRSGVRAAGSGRRGRGDPSRRARLLRLRSRAGGLPAGAGLAARHPVRCAHRGHGSATPPAGRRLRRPVRTRGSRRSGSGLRRAHVLTIMGDAGVRAFGLEASPDAVRGSAEGLDVRLGYPQAGLSLVGAPFSAFVSFNVLEHAVDPRDFLRGVRENLAPGGVGLVEVPDFSRTLELGRYYDFVADHLSYFTEPTLPGDRAAAASTCSACRPTGGRWTRRACRRRARAAAGDGSAQARLDKSARAVRAWVGAWSRAGGDVAVWGASHQALTLLAVAGVTGVEFVVDSAPFKQGLLTPVTHIPVVTPAQLTKSPPAAVLVMAAGFSDEVVAILRDQMGFSGGLAVLRGDQVVSEPGSLRRRATHERDVPE